MAYDQIHVVDATSQMIEIALRSSTTGQLLTGKAYGDITINYQREGAAAATTVSVVTATKGSYTSGGFVETDIAGLYQFGIPNAALATGAKAVTITFACTGALDVVKRIVLIGADLRNANSLGLAYLGGDAFARLGAPAGASVSADIAAVSAQIGAIGSGTGAALNFAVSEDNASAPIKTISAVGTQTGTYANTLADDGTTHQIASVGNAIDWIYGFNCGAARAASKVVLRGNIAAVGDTVTVSAYNFSTPGWDTRTTITGTAETLRDVPLLAAHTGTGADEGKVYIRFTFSEGDAAELVIDEAYIQAQQSGSLVGYALGAIWVNTNASNTNTVPYVDGTADNPVSTWAAALALSTALGIKRFKVAAASSITLTADSSEYEIIGDGLWSLALGGQDISNAFILKASVSGTGSGSGSIFEDCQIIANTSTGPAYFVRCGFNTPTGSPYNAAAAGQYAFADCVSLVAGSGTPYFDFVGTGSTTGVNFRRWSGGSNVTLDSNCTMTMEVVTGGGQTVTTGGANVEIRGICRAVTVALSASETVQVAAVTGPITISGAATAATVNIYGVHGVVTNTSTGSTINTLGVSRATVNAEADTALTDYDPPTNAELEARTLLAASYFDPATDGVNVTAISGDTTAADRLEAILDATPTGTVLNDSDPAPTTLLFETNLTEDTDDHYNGAFVVFYSGALTGQSRRISDYDGTNKIITVAIAFTEAPTAGDMFMILGRSE